MIRQVSKIALLAGCLAVAGQASAHGGPGPGAAVLGAVVGAVVGGAIVASSRAAESPVYVQAAPPPQVVYYPAQPVYYQPAPQVVEVVPVPPRYYGPPPGYYGPPRW
ncbi:hypothetical protein IQ22_01921 [Pseudomonas duriflava]|uniref:PXPV repeat-containing protein n=1 Tax=Pseudomonas duriflava TaxID=459528 RepID=A0A562QFR4_9PSED|nr:hypothetical protein [Pseudomonas duriflava]TWI55010.1 hypothetical protein IQ22_01921 [Pseudomonas duriflava]